MTESINSGKENFGISGERHLKYNIGCLLAGKIRGAMRSTWASLLSLIFKRTTLFHNENMLNGKNSSIPLAVIIIFLDGHKVCCVIKICVKFHIYSKKNHLYQLVLSCAKLRPA